MARGSLVAGHVIDLRRIVVGVNWVSNNLTSGKSAGDCLLFTAPCARLFGGIEHQEQDGMMGLQSMNAPSWSLSG
jgi:hypothetical protein